MKLTKDTVIFITGGASGLGLATAHLFFTLGCKVAIADLDSDAFDSIKSDFCENSGKPEAEVEERLIFFECDVSIENDVKQAIEGTASRFGGIHIAFACAGVMLLIYTRKLNVELFEKMLKINLFGSVYVAKYASKIIAKNKPTENGEKGLILFVSSVLASEGARGTLGYAASKGAINGLVLPMSRDLGRHGIRCVALAPGLFSTPMSDVMP